MHRHKESHQGRDVIMHEREKMLHEMDECRVKRENAGASEDGDYEKSYFVPTNNGNSDDESESRNTRTGRYVVGPIHRQQTCSPSLARCGTQGDMQPQSCAYASTRTRMYQSLCVCVNTVILLYVI